MAKLTTGSNESYYFRNNYYGGKHSIYSALKLWANMVYPPKYSFQCTSDTVSTILLSIISGLPVGKGSDLRIFYKVMACNLLAQHLSGNTVTIETVKNLRNNCNQVYNSLNNKRLTA